MPQPRSPQIVKWFSKGIPRFGVIYDVVIWPDSMIQDSVAVLKIPQVSKDGNQQVAPLRKHSFQMLTKLVIVCCFGGFGSRTNTK